MKKNLQAGLSGEILSEDFNTWKIVKVVRYIVEVLQAALYIFISVLVMAT